MSSLFLVYERIENVLRHSLENKITAGQYCSCADHYLLVGSRMVNERGREGGNSSIDNDCHLK